MLSILQREDGFITLTRNNDLSELNEYVDESWIELSNRVQLRLIDIGVIEVKPVSQSDQYIVISCGIHGNETAPIEIVSRLISQIVNSELEPKVNLLFVLGNPESMKASTRFVSINMNRLFASNSKNYPRSEENSYEIDRAERLEKLVSLFFERANGNEKIHLDLHTALKPSFHKTFAIRPCNVNKISLISKQLLSAMGIEAVLQQNKPSTSFAYSSFEKCSAEAYTLELGAVRNFGENDPDDFVMAIKCLQYLIANTDISRIQSKPLIEYKVVDEIIRRSEDFIFHVEEDVENFTSYPKGYLIAEDKGYNYRVTYDHEAIVFPNINVPVGQRVAIMVARENQDRN